MFHIKYLIVTDVTIQNASSGDLEIMSNDKWLLLMHKIPPKPDAVRVSIWRSLQKTFAIPVKNAVYALPLNGKTLSMFKDIAKEIEERGGEAVLCEVNFIKGVSNESLEQQYNDLLNQSFLELSKTLREVQKQTKKIKSGQDLMPIQHDLSRATSLLNVLAEKNFFHCDGEQICRTFLDEISKEILSISKSSSSIPAPIEKNQSYSGRIWVTRMGIAHDRVACAWLIKKHIDSRAEFIFVDPKNYKKSSSHITYDMYRGDFSHDGELCTFEVLLQRFKLKSASLKRLAEIIHDIDIGDDRYQHPATGGVRAILDGIISSTPNDVDRLALGSKCLDHLDASLRT